MQVLFPYDTADYNEKPRQKWVAEKLRSLPAGYRILDAGAGERQYAKYCSHLKYVAQDFAQYEGTGDGKGLQTTTWNQVGLDIISDIVSIPEPDASFDAILCTEVFEHIPDPLAALSSLSRLLKRGGILILSAPFCSLTHFSPYFYTTGFSINWYKKHLEDNGFEIIEMVQNGNFPLYMKQELDRIPFIAEKYASMSLRPQEEVAIRIIQSLLSRMNLRDAGSHELLCFGVHVLAKKI